MVFVGAAEAVPMAAGKLSAAQAASRQRDERGM
jgi:hypothetical protein